MPAFAMTLGRLQGAALLGQPLDISVSVQSAPDDKEDVPCNAVLVRYGDTQLSPVQVMVDQVPGATAGSQTLKIRTSRPVDEPSVTVGVQVGCSHQAMRRYILLTEMVPATEPSAPVPVTQTPAADSSNSIVASSIAPDRAKLAAPSPLPNPVAAPPVHKAAPAPFAATTAAPAKGPMGSASQQARPHLQLTAAPHGAVPELAAVAGLVTRVDAMSQRLDSFASAEEVRQTQAHMQVLEGQIKGIQTLTSKNQQNLMALAKLVEEGQTGLRSDTLVYVLAGLLALCVVGLGLLGLRLRSGQSENSRWWAAGTSYETELRGQSKAVVNGSSEFGAPSEAGVAVRPANPLASVRSSLPSSLSPPLGEAAEAAVIRSLAAKIAASVDVNLDAVTSVPASIARTRAGVLPTAAAPIAAAEKREFVNSNSSSLRAIDTKDLLDVRQQSDFFVALGQHEKAVRVLENSIRQSNAANPLVYLELLKIFHTLVRGADFERYRQEFNSCFTGYVPSYEEFLDEGKSLESYERVCDQIVSLWGTPDVIDFLELCMVRSTRNGVEQRFDLQAFRDLLMLHGVVSRLDDAYDSDLVQFSASRMASMPMDVEAEVVDVTSAPAVLVPPGHITRPPVGTASLQRLDLDLDEAKPTQEDMIDFDLSGYSHLSELKPSSN